jgi:Ca2+-binding EF-hand superfamily protein
MARFDYNVLGLFRNIDDWSYKYLDTKNIKRFLMKTSVYPDEHLLKAVIRRLDSDGDARLSFKEFSEAVKPIFQVGTTQRYATA